MRRVVLALLLCSTSACREPTWVRDVPVGPESPFVDGGEAPGVVARLQDSGVPSEPDASTPGRAVVPSTSSFGVLPYRAVAGALALEKPSFFPITTVCTESLCATGGLTP